MNGTEAMADALRGKKILLWGFGREGRSTHRFLRSLLPAQTLWIADKTPPPDCDDSNTVFLRRERWTEDFGGFDLVFRSPGIPLLDPAIRRDKLTSQTNLFLSRFAAQTVGITGTKGKSTTAALTHHVLVSAGRKAVLLGNIGLPCLDCAGKLTADDIVVFELSCHQLEDACYSPRVAVHLNLFEDHLDHYGDYARYAAAKDHIFSHQGADAYLLMGADLRSRKPPPYAEFIGYGQDGGAKPCAASDAYREADMIVYPDHVCLKGHCLPLSPPPKHLPGLHNRYCAAAAYWICRHYGISDAEFCSALESFRGLPHRLQYVATVNGVSYYDDSISTICEATVRALEALGDVDSLLLGGMDRGIDYAPLAAYLTAHPVRNVILMPDSGLRIAPLLPESGTMTTHTAKDLEEAVYLASRVTERGKSCLLSPAAASYGFFKDFAERGECFSALVSALNGLGSND